MATEGTTTARAAGTTTPAAITTVRAAATTTAAEVTTTQPEGFPAKTLQPDIAAAEAVPVAETSPDFGASDREV